MDRSPDMVEAAVERLGLRARRALWAAAVVVCAVGAGAAQKPPVKATPAEWDQAMTAVRGISLDSDQTAPRRADAIVAYAKLILLRGRPDDAVKLCREILSTASAGEVAIAAVRANGATPDALIVDYRLREGRTGTQAIERLRREFNADLPSLIVTGDTAPEPLRDVRDAGYPLLHKPAQPAMLRAFLQSAWRQRRRAEPA